jgi:hypothetical protein
MKRITPDGERSLDGNLLATFVSGRVKKDRRENLAMADYVSMIVASLGLYFILASFVVMIAGILSVRHVVPYFYPCNICLGSANAAFATGFLAIAAITVMMSVFVVTGLQIAKRVGFGAGVRYDLRT